MKKLLTAVAISAVALGAFAQTKELKVAIDPTYEPFTFKTPDGKPTGFDVDIANAVCEHIKRMDNGTMEGSFSDQGGQSSPLGAYTLNKHTIEMLRQYRRVYV